MKGRLTAFARNWWSVLAAAVILILWLTELALGSSRASVPVSIVLATVSLAGLAFVRWFPFPAAMITVMPLVIGALVDPTTTFEVESISLPVVVAICVFGSMCMMRERLAGLAVVVGGVVALFLRVPESLIDPQTSRAPALISNLIIFAVLWGVSWTIASRVRATRDLRLRAVELEAASAERARVAVESERGRIARELHDVVAHNVSVMVVQAGGVRRLLDPGLEREREALATIEETGRRALAEMRRMVGVMRGAESTTPEREPQPGLARLDRLVDEIRDAGLPVMMTIEGTPTPLGAGIDLSAYRIVQEALTNTLKHAGPARASVTVRYASGNVELVVEDDGIGRASSNGGAGHGLIGMRERVGVYGGTLDAGPKPRGGFRLEAILPIEAPLSTEV
jgi:signal transduction histidine kinase